jgi:nitrogenase molybdenum-iron protein alpha/beta subunit
MALVKDGIGQNETLKSLPLLIAQFLMSNDDFNMMNETQKAAEISKLFISMSKATVICISLIESGMINHDKP